MNYANQISDILRSSPPLVSNVKPADWAKQKRVMSSDVSPYPGKFSYDRTPYLEEPVNHLSPESDAQVIAVMKGAQIGFSTGVIENGIGWIIDSNPGNIILAARDESLVKKMVDSKIDQMIDSCGLRKLIRPNIIRKKNARSGDTSTGKEYPGGSLSAYSIQTPGKMRQISAKYQFLDDWEAAPNDKDAGDPAALFMTRSQAYGKKKKVYFISTPEVKQTSNIEPVYLQGDQRKYHIPCPCCGDYIELEWSGRNEQVGKYGMSWNLDEQGRLIEDSVGYVCQSCGDKFDESRKGEWLKLGKWIPTAEPMKSGYYSYHISALYAPPGMDDWVKYVNDYIECFPKQGGENIEKYKTFVNTCLGKTWEAQGEKPKASGISLNTRSYPVGMVPEEQSMKDGNGRIVMITMGSDMNGKEDDARLDWEVVAWSESGASYSVSHGSIGTFIPRENSRKEKVDRERWSYNHGSRNSVWPEFQKIISSEWITDTGRQMKITITGLDTGYFTTLAYQFLDKCEGNIVGLKGKDGDKFRAPDKDTKTFKKGHGHAKLNLVEVNLVKDNLADHMKLKWEEGDGDQPPYFMNFPEPSGGKYTSTNFFSHFESEHRVVDMKNRGNGGTRWKKVKDTVQNHMWDCRVYNIVLKDIFSHAICKSEKIEPSFDNYARLISEKLG